PHSVGHDGAVVIDGDIVTRFGCHLPLSPNASRYRNLGLRHTAALGLSERSDAISIVVSEERGTVCIAEGERIKEVSVSALKGALVTYYTSKAPVKKPGPLARWLKENTKEKVIAVLLACILWMIFGYQRESIQKDFTIPVEYLNIPPEWVIEGPKISEARVMFVGPPQAFQILNMDALKLSLNLSQLQEGKQDIVLTKDMIDAPSNLTIVGIKPSRITVFASRFVHISAPVEVVTENTPPPGVVIQKITVTPPSIAVLVPGKLLHTEIRIRTAPIDLRLLASTTTFAPRLIVPPEVQFESRKEPSVKVVIKTRS
ncbi:MAG: diadenylate cyclase, partial [Syntrophales bacterium]